MSSFSECLARIKEHRELTDTKIAELCDLDVTVVFRWRKGERFPENWSKVNLLVTGLHLSDEERKELESAYARTLFGEDKYKTYKRIIDILYTLQHCRTENKKVNVAPTEKYKEPGLPQFLVLKNKMDVQHYIKELVNAQIIYKKKKLYLKMITVNSEFNALLKLLLSNSNECNIEEIIYLEDKGSFYEYRNAQFLKEIIEMIFSQKRISVYCADEGECETGDEMNWILSDDFFMEFNDAMTEGMITSDKEWIKLSMENFKIMTENYHILGRHIVDEMKYLSDAMQENTRIQCIEFQPCLGLGFTKEILEEYLHKELPHRDILIEKILSNWVAEGEIKYNAESVFAEEGLRNFMETGIVEECPDNLYRPIDMPVRCQILRNVIEKMKEKRIFQHMIKDRDFPDMTGVRIEQLECDNETILGIEIHFMDTGTNEDGEVIPAGRKERFETVDLRIVSVFEVFWECIKNERYTYSHEETIECMERVLEEYEEKG